MYTTKISIILCTSSSILFIMCKPQSYVCIPKFTNFPTHVCGAPVVFKNFPHWIFYFLTGIHFFFEAGKVVFDYWLSHDIWYHKNIDRWVWWQLTSEFGVAHRPGRRDLKLLGFCFANMHMKLCFKSNTMFRQAFL